MEKHKKINNSANIAPLSEFKSKNDAVFLPLSDSCRTNAVAIEEDVQKNKFHFSFCETIKKCFIFKIAKILENKSRDPYLSVCQFSSWYFSDHGATYIRFCR